MFSFEPTNEIDIKEYEYELYADPFGSTLVSKGKASASVFTIDVPRKYTDLQLTLLPNLTLFIMEE
jgi:hypothetical protein